MTMTIAEALAEYADAEVALARAKELGDAATIARAGTLRAEAQAALIKAKATKSTEPSESMIALKKENAELTLKIVRLVDSVREESDAKWKALNRVAELEWAERESKGEKMPNFGAQTAIIPANKKTYPPFKFDASDLFPDWDESA